jgi:hypothetical protein
MHGQQNIKKRGGGGLNTYTTDVHKIHELLAAKPKQFLLLIKFTVPPGLVTPFLIR